MVWSARGEGLSLGGSGQQEEGAEEDGVGWGFRAGFGVGKGMEAGDGGSLSGTPRL